MKIVLLPPNTAINGFSIESIVEGLQSGTVLSYWYLLIGIDADPVLLYKGRCVDMSVADDNAGINVLVPEFVDNGFVNSNYHALWILHPSLDPDKFFDDWKEQFLSSMPSSWLPVGLERGVIEPVTTVPLEEVVEQPNTQPV